MSKETVTHRKPDGDLQMKGQMIPMNRLLRKILCMAVIMAAPCARVLAAQEKPESKITQTAGVDNTRMGAYRALAQLCFQAFQRGVARRFRALAIEEDVESVQNPGFRT